jgi:hypothetical protein
MSYEPKPGGKAAAALAALEQGAMGRPQLGEVMGIAAKQVDQYLATARKNGRVELVKVGPNRSVFRLCGSEGAGAEMPANVPQFVPETTFDPPAEEHAFNVALWNDGELDIFGVAAIEQNGVAGVRLPREQASELVRLLTGCSVI